MNTMSSSFQTTSQLSEEGLGWDKNEHVGHFNVVLVQCEGQQL